MGISSTTNRVSFTGDGSSTIFAFPYYFFSPNDLAVYLYDTNSSIVTAQAINTNYTISGNVNSQGVYPSGGNVVMNSSFPSSYQLIITRSPSPIQNFQLNQNGPINSLALTQQLDYLTTLVQRLQDEVSRAVQLPDGLGAGANGAFNTTLPSSIVLASTAFSPLVVNSGGNGWTFGVVASGASGAVSYAGILPVPNGGTGQGGGLTPNAVWYSVTGSSMAQTNVGKPGQVLMANSGAVPVFTQLDISNSSNVTGALSATAGGTGLSTFVPQFGVMYASSNTQMSIVPSAAAGSALLAKGSSAPVFEQMNLSSSSQFTGILPVANGGTNASSAPQALINLWPTPLTRGDILVVNSGSVVSRLAVGADNFVLTANSSSSNSTGVVWLNPSSTPQSLASKTASYQMTANDDFILVSSSLFTITLPDATTATKKQYRITKTENTTLTLPSQIVLSGSGAQTIGTYGNSVNILTPNESWVVFPDGANWQVQEHYSTTKASNAGGLTITASGGGAVKGSTFYETFYWQRRGTRCDWRWDIKLNGGTAGSGDYSIAFPGFLIADTSIVQVNSSALGGASPSTNFTVIGNGFGGDTNNTTVANMYPYLATSALFKIILQGLGVFSVTAFTLANGKDFSINGSHDVAGWQP